MLLGEAFIIRNFALCFYGENKNSLIGNLICNEIEKFSDNLFEFRTLGKIFVRDTGRIINVSYEYMHHFKNFRKYFGYISSFLKICHEILQRALNWLQI